MAYDPCGTTRLEGDEMLRRLAKYLGVSPEDLKRALLKVIGENNGSISD